ncbi:hypothetical protein [Lysobacter sp. Root690]|uniref:hypothetical protein n=1 Tax=Lysobacter sp. Root690 TaxID=1736588 RepID=UPI000700D2A2|nr:hypothetical protein [Lysobacter sp. Root690]KRB07618.1 hypothetical protein ASD86_07230 [Lysobacter sp. Root690]
MNDEQTGFDLSSFQSAGLDYLGRSDGLHLWRDGNGDSVALASFARPPDIGADLDDPPALRAFYRAAVEPAGCGVIEIDSVRIDGCAAVRTVFKQAHQPSGRCYLGSLTLPFRDASHVLQVFCAEEGITGVRDNAVLMQLLQSGELEFGDDGVLGWLDDPYEPGLEGPLTRNRSERREHDAGFPEHPLSRVRALLDRLQGELRVSEDSKRQPAFRFRAQA